MAQEILIIGAFDTKGAEYGFLRDQIVDAGFHAYCMNTGVHPTEGLEFPVDTSAREVAAAGGQDIDELRKQADRGSAMRTMAEGAARLVGKLFAERNFAGAIGMGGSGGTSVIATAMRALPIGVPKVCVSTVASSDTSPYVGEKDVVLIPAITDIAGLNRISRRVIAQAAGAVCGMAAVPPISTDQDRPIVAASMFGNTTTCVNFCRERLNQSGFEVLVFHAVGSGGRSMETLIGEGLVDACLDITTTEWADELCGGIFGAGPDRLAAAGRVGIPHVIVPGCIDMVNFGPMESVPARYRDAGRQLYAWNPAVTLMRTNLKENRQLGKVFADKANAAKGPVTLLLPMRGVSILDGEGERFCDWETDQAMFASLREHLRSDIAVVEVDANINDETFAAEAVEVLLSLLPTSPG